MLYIVCCMSGYGWVEFDLAKNGSCSFKEVLQLNICTVAYLHIHTFSEVCSCTFAHLHFCTFTHLHRCAFAALSLTLIHSPRGLGTLVAFQPTQSKVLHNFALFLMEFALCIELFCKFHMGLLIFRYMNVLYLQIICINMAEGNR